MTNHKVLLLAINLALLSGLSYSTALAQETRSPSKDSPPVSNVPPGVHTGEKNSPATEDSNAKRTQVVGTRIKRGNIHDFGQYTIITAEEIRLSGVTNIEQLLTTLPTFTLGGNKTAHPMANGLVTVDLRNLGPSNTLVLINGHRANQELSTVPVPAIERVEVYYGGASAVYGTGAVAGVIDIILKREFTGIDANVYTGMSSKGDGQKIGVSTTLGISRKKGNAALSLNWLRRAPVYMKDRRFANPPCEWVAEDATGRTTASRCGGIHPGGAFRFHGLRPSSLAGFTHGWTFHGPNGDFNATQPIYEEWLTNPNGHPYDLYNYGEEMGLAGYSDRFHTAANGELHLSDSLTVYADGFFAHQKHGQRWAGGAIADQTMHLSNPFIPTDFWHDVILADGIDPYDPVIRFDKRANEAGARLFLGVINDFRGIVGIRADISPEMRVDVFGNYSRNFHTSTSTNWINRTNFKAAFDPTLCYQTPGCVIANAFGEGVMSEDAATFITYNREYTLNTSHLNAGTLFSLTPFQLPGGPLDAVAGADVKWYRLDRNLIAYKSSQIDLTDNDAFTGEYQTQAVFAEIAAPILGDLPGVNLMEINLSGRLTKLKAIRPWSSYAANLIYAPLESLRFRGGVHSDFITPSLNDYLDRSSPPNFTRPYEFEYLLNPKLTADKAQTLKLGTVIRPTFMPDVLPLIITLDWYKIEHNSFRNLSTYAVTNLCDDGNSTYCDYIEIDPDTEEIIRMVAPRWVVDQINSRGSDLAVKLGFPLFRAIKGTLGHRLSVVHKNVMIQPKNTNNKTNPLNHIRNWGAAVPKFRHLTSLDIDGNIWTIRTQIRALSEMKMYEETIDSSSPATHAFDKVAKTAYWDLSGRLRLGDFELVVGVDNILDWSPPFYPGSTFNAQPQAYDLIGRYIFANIGYRLR